MRILFVALGQENLGQEYLSAALKHHGHDTALAFDPGLFDDNYQFSVPTLARLLDSRAKLFEEIAAADPDIVCFTVMANNVRWANEVARWVRANTRALIGFGGIHPTIYPDQVIVHDHVDFVGLGEAEESFPEFVDALELGDGSHTEVAGIWVKHDGEIHRNPIRPPVEDLDRLPRPDKELFASEIPVRAKYRIATSRGCPNNCHFCGNGSWLRIYKGGYLRRRSPENVLAELREGKRRYRFKWVAFYDDIFVRDREWLEAFLPRFKEEIGVHFSANGFAGSFDTDLVPMLYDCGLRFLEIGVQSAREDIRRKTLNRRESNDDITRVIVAARKAGIHTQVDHMFGVPGEDAADQVRAMRWYNEIRPTRVGCFSLTFYPGTALFERARRDGWLSAEAADAIERGELDTYHDGGTLQQRHDRELARAFELLYRLMPLVPRPVIRRLLDMEAQKHLGNAPVFVLHGLDLIMGYLTEHNVLQTYVRQYLKQTGRLVRWRLARVARSTVGSVH